MFVDEVRGNELNRIDAETSRYIFYMCRRDCKFFNKETGCQKHRVVRECARRGLKNKDEQL